MNKTHGLSKTPEYMTWNRMLSRCYNPIVDRYKNYGGRGIKVCNDWHLFVNFYRDMGDRPTKNHSLGRINNDLDYCKENCRWETKEQQDNNTTRTVYLTVDGVKKSVSLWAKETGLSYGTIISRYRLGIPHAECIKNESRIKKLITVNGVEKKTTEWMRYANIPISSFYHFKRKGKSEDEIIKSYLALKAKELEKSD